MTGRRVRARTARPLWGLIAAAGLLIPAGIVGAPAAHAAGPGVTAGERGAAPCSLSTGPYQEETERHLGLTVDGVQSATDCAAIQAFQVKHGINPAQGYAGLYTYRAVVWEEALARPGGPGGCPATSGVVVCIDMDRQILWVEEAGAVVFRPVPARTGMPGYPTRTGWHEIFDREKEFWSTLYDGPMPFAQFFDRGQALHASYRDIWEDPGSHGCVNLRYEDAKTLWNILRLGDEVYVWGRRTGD
ncbi:L,D-transpeptidase [Streptomyces sp. NPDC051567]|uniref:L,D-transpeptidase n=1 Tax=Streptomyces sp. NPDC051567 TaxID=3365660 RepID=UPI0037BB3BA8